MLLLWTAALAALFAKGERIIMSTFIAHTKPSMVGLLCIAGEAPMCMYCM